jgi:hypothetical protein
MILQTDSRLKSDIREFGCYFMSILWFAVKYVQIELDTQLINDIYQTCFSYNYIGDECWIKDPDRIFQIACNSKRRWKFTQKHELPYTRCNIDQVEILHFHYVDEKGKEHDHFVAGDGFGNVAYDPWGESETVRSGYLENKRIFTLL